MVLCCGSLFLTAVWLVSFAASYHSLLTHFPSGGWLFCFWFTAVESITMSLLVTCLLLNLYLIFFCSLFLKLKFLTPGKMYTQFNQILPKCFSEKLPHFIFAWAVHEGVPFPVPFPPSLPTWGFMYLSRFFWLVDVKWLLTVVLFFPDN